MMGARSWFTETPKFPRPAFRPSAKPWSLLGKKNEMPLMDDAKAPPPKPQQGATMQSSQNGQSEFAIASPMATIGMIASVEFIAFVIWPPVAATMKELGPRRVAPASPAMDGSMSK